MTIIGYLLMGIGFCIITTAIWFIIGIKAAILTVAILCGIFLIFMGIVFNAD